MRHELAFEVKNQIALLLTAKKEAREKIINMHSVVD